VHDAGGGGALLAFGAFEKIEPAFTPTPTTPDPQSIQDTLNAPDTSEWTGAMDTEIENMHQLNIYKEVPCPDNKNIITP
jgi:hypothetical protein